MENTNTAVDADVTLDEDEVPATEAVAEDTGKTVEAEPAESGKTEASEEIDVSIGDSPTQKEDAEKAPEWVREVRKTNRELHRKNRELEEKLKAISATENNPVDPGPKPTLEGADYDTEKYEAKLAEWFDRKRKAAEIQSKAEEEQKAQQAEWHKKLENDAKSKTELKVQDYEDAEASVQEVLNTTQQGILLQGSENSALLVYALGKNPKKAKELAEIKDPVRFAFAVAKLETQLKVTKKTAPPPEKTPPSGGARSTGGSDEVLDNLRAKAERTGDYTQVLAYKRQLQSKK
jgi:hypothetical protein